MKEPLSDEEITHPLNESLLKEAEEIKAERKLLKVRLEKLDETKSGVSEAVYQRVRGEYLKKINQTTERLASLKKDLEEEEQKIVEKKNLVEAQIRLQNETIEESELRHALGEFTTEEHQGLVQKKKTEVARLEAALKGLSEGLKRHVDIFVGEDLGKPVAQPAPVVPQTAPVKPVSKAVDLSSITAENTARIQIEPAKKTDPVTPLKETARSPAQVKAAELAVFNHGNVIQTVPIQKTVHIGRSPSNDIILKAPKVSRRHAEIQQVAGKFVLLDLESSNGTFVSGKRITEHTLEPDDEIVIGGTKIVFKISALAAKAS